jgi:diacylglycerol kinase family enzyme
MQNISVYLNQRASNGSRDWQTQISNALFRSNLEYQSPDNLDELYQQLELDVANEVDAVLSIGGDGTVNTIIQRLAGTEISLLVVPGGTANDFARVLGASANIKLIAQTVRQNVKKKIDLISINGKFMATNGGLGFAADVAEEINDLRINHPHFKKVMKVSGKRVYSLFLAKKLLSREIKSHTFSIQSNEFNETVISPLILVNNQPTLAGNFTVAPNTNHQDGTVNITIFKHQNRIELVQCILKILSGNYPANDKNLISFETSAAKIMLLDGQIPFFGDGEILSSGSAWDIKCHSNFLSVFSLKGQDEMNNICIDVTLA